jgi:AAA15 family ATPase/GTPase
MRKLTVKNFSVIKEAELEFGKITVLIGPQSSGKSLLCKLAYFFGKEFIDIAVGSVIAGRSLHEFRKEISEIFAARFPIEISDNPGSFLCFEADDFRVERQRSGEDDVFGEEFWLSPKFETTFSALSNLDMESPANESDFSSDRREQVRARFNLLQSARQEVNPFVHRTLYIPNGRSFFVNTSQGFRALDNPDIDPLTREFGSLIAWGRAWNPDPVLGDQTRQNLEAIRRSILAIAGGYIDGRDSYAEFVRFSDKRRVPFTLLSSGTQEILPLFNVIERMITEQRRRVIFPRNGSVTKDLLIASKGWIYVEEPEANVFPKTQYQLVQLFSCLSSDPDLDFSWVITTHSPYLLSSFNNLIEAGQVVRDHAELREEVAKIVPEQYWIKDGDFKAYSIHEGKLESILNESGFIEGNYLDQVSDVIEKEFDQLLRLEYDHSEAS